jgi:hypothetical protein
MKTKMASPVIHFACMLLLFNMTFEPAHPQDIHKSNQTVATVEPMGINFSIAPKFDGSREQGKPGIAFDGTSFFTAWHQGGNLYGARVSPQGNLLDADGIAISVGLNDAASAPSVSFDGTNVLVVWAARRDSSTEIYAARVTKNGVVLDPGGVQITVGSDPFTIYDEPQVPAVAFDGVQSLAVWSTNTYAIKGTRISTSCTNLDTPEGFTINETWSNLPAVAYGSGYYLVTWLDDWNNAATSPDVYAARVSPAGAVLDPGGFMVTGGAGAQDSVTVAFANPNFLVVWVDSPSAEPSRRTVYAARVALAGTVLDNPAVMVMERVWGAAPVQAACDSDMCVIAAAVEMPGGISFRLSDVFAVRMTQTGQILDQQAIPVSTSTGHQSEPVIAFGADRYLVAFNETMGQLAYLGISAQILQKLPGGSPAIQTQSAAPHKAQASSEQKKWVQQVIPVANSAELEKVIVFSRNNAYLFSEWGQILKYDGSHWQVHFSSGQGKRFGLYASGPNDIWVGGNCRGFVHFNGSYWEDMGCNSLHEGGLVAGVWGTGTGQMWAAANFGEVLKFVSTYQWQTIATGTDNNLADVWGTSASNIYAVGERGTIMHYNGTNWGKIAGIPTLQTLNAIWGSGPNDIFVVGDWGTILHYDGVSWKLQESGTTHHLFDLWGLKKDDYYAVGYDGTVLHHDGLNWEIEDSGTTRDLLGVWGVYKASPLTHFVLASGAGGTLLKKDFLEYTFLSPVIR